MKKFINSNWLIVLGVALGAIGGYLYWMFVGCESGTCAITSKPLNSSAYGAMMGGLFFSIVKPTKKKNSETT